MANEIKNYFLAPSWDYPPNGPIALGNIVRAVDKIVPPLYAHKPTESKIPTNLAVKTGVTWSRAKSIEGRFGVWAKFLQFLGVGVDVRVDSDDTVYHFERIDTEEFFPDEEAVREKMACPAVKSYIEKSRFRKEVYMIVGIKRVTGANVKSTVERKRGGELNVGLDTTGLTGAPVSMGPRVKYTTGKKDEVSFEGSDEFVFAFRLRKVRVNKKDEVEQDDHRKGTLLGDQVDRVPVSETFSVLGLEDRDASGEDFGLKEQELVMDGEEKVQVVATESP